MKKFFSIFCALAIVLSVSAAPVSKKDVLAGKVVKKEIRSQHASSVVKDATFKSFDTKSVSVVKVAPQSRVAAGKAIRTAEGKKALKSKVAFKAPKAQKDEAISLAFSSDNEEDEVDWLDNCASDGWWQIAAENEEAYVSISNLDREVAAGEYAWEDLDPDYCGFWLDGMEGVENFVNGSCTVSVDETDGLKVDVVGTFEDAEGSIYEVNVHFAKSAIVPGDYDFVAVSESHTFYATDGDVYYRFADANDNTIRFDIVVAEGLEDVELDKVYTLDDMLADYCGVTFDEESASFVEASFKKTLDGETEKYEATATDEFGRIFHVSYEFTAPEAENFETITAEATITKEAYWFWYLYTFTAADEANAIVLEILPDDSYYGTWEAGKDITGAVTPLNGLASEIYSGEVTIEKTAEGCSITGKVLCFNNTEYTLNLTYTKPAPNREEVLIIEGLELNVFDGAWQLSGYNEDFTKFVSVAAYADEVTGNYTDAELAADYTYVATDITEEGYNLFELVSADLTVQFTEEDSTIVIAGNLTCQNGEDVPQFTVLLKGKIPAPEVSDMTFEITADEDGITVTPSNDEDPWDWYIADEETFEYFGGAEGLAQAVYDSYGNTYAITGELFLAWDGEEIANYCAAGGKFYLVAWGAGAREITTDVASFEFEYEATGGNQYDAEEEDFIVDFPEFEIDDEYVAEYGVVFVEAVNDNNEYISLEIWLPEGATELVPGEYAVSAEEEVPQTVTATELDLSAGRIYGSFAGTISGQNINVPLWFIAEGKVTVQEDGIIVNATNTWGRKIYCILGDAVDAVEDINADVVATKRIQNATLIIEKNGVRYNVLGTVIK